MALPIAVIAGVTFAGSLLQAKGAMDAADSQAAAAKAQAAAKRGQAVELLKRARINRERTRLKGLSFQKEQMAGFAGGGVAITSGSTLAALNDTINKVEQNVEDQMQEASYKASMLMKGADIDAKLAGDIQEAGKWQAFGSVLAGGAMAAKMVA